jgi:hypothetical protein
MYVCTYIQKECRAWATGQLNEVLLLAVVHAMLYSLRALTLPFPHPQNLSEDFATSEATLSASAARVSQRGRNQLPRTLTSLARTHLRCSAYDGVTC